MAQVRRTIQAGLSGISVPVGVTTNGTRNLGALNNSLVQTRKNMMASTKQLSSFNQAIVEHGQNLGTAARRYATFMAGAAGFFLLFKQLGKAQKDFIDFQNSLVRLAQITGGTVESVKAIGDEVDRLATKYGIASSKLLGVADTLAQAGLTAKDTKVALEALAQTELAPTFDDINNTVQGGIAAMSQFGYAAKDLKAIFGQINQVSAKFAVESKDIVTAVRISGGAFQAAGGDLQELMALFTSVRATTRESAESIATGFRTIFTRLQRKDTLIFLDNLGIKLTDMEGKFVGPYNAVRELSGALANLDKTDPRFSQIIEELGGYRQISKVIPLITKFGSTAESALGVARAGSNSLEATTTKSAESISRQLEMLGERFNKLYRDIAQSKGMQAFGRLLLYIANTAITVADAMKDLIGTVLSLYAVFSLLRLSSVGKGFIGGFVGGKPRKMASGGKADDANSLLMPGEIVIGKREAQKIGYGKLDALNRGVAKVPGVGNTDSVPAYLEEGSYVLKKSIAKKMGLEGYARGGRTGRNKARSVYGKSLSQLPSRKPPVPPAMPAPQVTAAPVALPQAIPPVVAMPTPPKPIVTPFSDPELVDPAPNQHPVVTQMNRRESRRQEQQKLEVMGIDQLIDRIVGLTVEIENLESEIKKNGVDNVDLGKLEDSRMKRQMATRKERSVTKKQESEFNREFNKLQKKEDANKKIGASEETRRIGRKNVEKMSSMDTAKLQSIASSKNTYIERAVSKMKSGGSVNMTDLKKAMIEEAAAKKEIAKREKQAAAQKKKDDAKAAADTKRANAKKASGQAFGATEAMKVDARDEARKFSGMKAGDLRSRVQTEQDTQKQLAEKMKVEGATPESKNEMRKSRYLEAKAAKEAARQESEAAKTKAKNAADAKRDVAKTNRLKTEGGKEKVGIDARSLSEKIGGMKLSDVEKMKSKAVTKQQDLAAELSAGKAIDPNEMKRAKAEETIATKELKRRESAKAAADKKTQAKNDAQKKKDDAATARTKATGEKESVKQYLKSEKANFKKLSDNRLNIKVQNAQQRQQAIIEAMKSGKSKSKFGDAANMNELNKQKGLEQLGVDQLKENEKIQKEKDKALAAAKQKAVDAMIEFADGLKNASFEELKDEGDNLASSIRSGYAPNSQENQDKLRMIRSSQAVAAGLDENGNIQSRKVDTKTAISNMANRRAEVAQSQYHRGKISSKELADANMNAKKASEDLQAAIRSETDARIESLKSLEQDQSLSNGEREGIAMRRQELELARDENETRISSEGALGGFGMSGNKAMTLVTENFALIAAAVAGAATAWISATTHIQRMSEVTASLNGEMTAQQETIARETAARESTISGLTTFAAVMGGVAYGLQTSMGAKAAASVGTAALSIVPALSGLGIAAASLGAGILAVVAIFGVAAYAWVDSARQYRMEMGAQLEEARKANVGSLVSQISHDLGMLNQEFVNSTQDISNVSAKFNKAFELINANTDARQQTARKENSTTWDSISTNLFGESNEYKARMDNFAKEGMKSEKSTFIASADPINDMLQKQMDARVKQMVSSGLDIDKAIEKAMSEVDFSSFAEKLAEVRRAAGDVAESQESIIKKTNNQLLKQALLTQAKAKETVAVNQAANSIRRFNTLLASVESVSIAMDDLADGANVYGSVMGGNGISSAASEVRGLEMEGTNNFEQYNEAVDRIGKAFGDGGKLMASEAKLANQLPSLMEDMLVNIRREGVLESDDRFADRVRTAVGELEQRLGVGSTSSAVVSNKLKALNDPEIVGKATNEKAFAEELVEGLQDSAKIIAKMNQVSTDALNKMGKMYESFKDAEIALADRLVETLDRQATSRESRIKLQRFDARGFEGDEMRPENLVKDQVQAMTGMRDTGAINAKLFQNFTELKKLSAIPKDKLQGKDIQAINDLNTENKRLVKGLEMAADASKRLSGIMERLATIEAEKTNRGDINAEIATGGMKAVRQIAMEDQAARMAIARGGLREDIADPRAAKENEMALSGLNRMKDVEANQAVPQKFLEKLGFVIGEKVNFGQIGDKLKQRFQAQLPGEQGNRNQANAILQRRGLEKLGKNDEMGGLIIKARVLEEKRSKEIMRQNKRLGLNPWDKSTVVQRMTKDELGAAGLQKQELKQGQRFETDTEKALRMDAEKLRGLAGAARIKNDVGNEKGAEEAKLKGEGEKILNDADRANNAVTNAMREGTQNFMRQLLVIQEQFFARLEANLVRDIDNGANANIRPLENERKKLEINNMKIQAARENMRSIAGDGTTNAQLDYANTEIGFSKIKAINESKQREMKLEEVANLIPTGRFNGEDVRDVRNPGKIDREHAQKLADAAQIGLEKLGESGKPLLESFLKDGANGVGIQQALRNLQDRMAEMREFEFNTQMKTGAEMQGRFGIKQAQDLNLEQFAKERSKLTGMGSTEENNRRISQINEEIKVLEARRDQMKKEVPGVVEERRRNGEIGVERPGPAKQDMGQKASDLNGVFAGLLGGFGTFIKSFDSTTAALTKSLDMLQGAKIEIAGTTKVDINLTGGEALLKIGEAVRKEVMVAVGEKLKQSFPGNSGQIAANFPSGNTNSGGQQGSGAVA